MAIKIASLFASIGADTSGLQKGLKDSESQIKTTANSLKGFGSELARQVVGTVGLATAVYKVGQAVIESTVNWADYADTMRISAQMSGITVEEMSRLVQAADDFRVPIETMQRSMEMALKNGFVPTIENIATLSDLLLSIENPAARAAAASDIFGKSYADMMPFLMAGGDTIRTTTNDIADNLVVTEEAARQAKEYTDALDDMGDAWTGLQNTLGQFLVPVATNVFTSLTKDLQQYVLEVELLSTANKALGDQKIGWTEFWNAIRLGEDVNSPTYIEDVNEAILDLNLLMGENTPRVRTFRAEQAALGDEILRQSDSWEEYRNELKAAGIEAFVSEPAWQAEKALSAMSTSLDTMSSSTLANQQRLSAWRTEIAQTSQSLREELATAYTTVAEAEMNWRMGVSGTLKGKLDEEFEAHRISAEKYKASLDLIDQTYGTNYVLQYDMELAIDDLFKSLLEDPEGFVAKAAALEDYFMPLDAAVQASMTLVGDLQAQLTALEKTYTAKINIVIATYGSMGNLPIGGGEGGGENGGGGGIRRELRATGGYSLAGQPYIVGEAGAELFIPDTNGRVYSNASTGAMLGGNNNGDLLAAIGRLPSASDIALAVRDALLMVGA